MNPDLPAMSALLVGLLGSTHCIGMCGGIVGTLTLGLAPGIRHSRLRMAPYLLAYNVGRITSYTIAGLLVGFLGSQITEGVARTHAQLVGRLVSGGFMVLLGLYLADWWRALTWLEGLGSRLWRRIEPLGRRFFPVTNPAQALGLGLVWGWLPCGLVYSALALALTAGSAAEGGKLMLVFGLGTLPALLVAGLTAAWLRNLARNTWLRRITGALVVAAGLATLFMPGLYLHAMSGHAEHGGMTRGM
ncbi:MAG: sulfite exporter TauE/SafE family protein [Acidiferrobacterales bacterium]